MALPVWADNAIAYSLQIAILASAGTLLAYLFRLRVPRVSFLYWQVLLLACLLLPALQSWEHPVQFRQPAFTGTVAYEIPTIADAVKTQSSFSITPEAIGLAVVAGACLRILWLAIGYLRLRRLLRHSRPLPPSQLFNPSLPSRIGVQARFFLSNRIDSPATFGLFTPRILLPESFLDMSEACRKAVICHELLHVRRLDWAVILIEEFVRSVYWFHPAVWWLLAKIHLAREQSIDHEVVRLTGNRQPYLDSLLEIARSRGRPGAVPAPLFLKERHLAERVALLIKEVSMNRLRLAFSLVGIAVFLGTTVHYAAGWFPLTGAPIVVQEETTDNKIDNPKTEPAPKRVGNAILESQLIRKVDPVYPELARRARVSGSVVLQINVDEEGFVSDVQVLSGHPMLNQAAVDAVKQWKYRPTLLNGKAIPVLATVTVVFPLEDDKAEAGSGIVGGIPGGVIGGIIGKTPDGQPPPPPPPPRESRPAPQKIGNAILGSQPIRKVDPVYPELAIKARVSGSVVLQINVDEEGSVSDVKVLSGHPMLVQAAVDAVKQWEYRPTLLDGKAIPVIATVTVVFALPDSSTPAGTGIRGGSGSGIGPGAGSGIGAGVGPGSGSGIGQGKVAPATETVMFVFAPDDNKEKTGGFVVGGVPGGVVGGFVGKTPDGKVPPPPPPSDDPRRPAGAGENSSQQTSISIGSRVMESRLISKILPSYPEPAQKARVSGNVILQVTVDEDGSVSDVQVAQGHPFFRQAAIDAVKQWKYEPVLMNGKAIAVKTNVTIGFSFDDDKATTGIGPVAPPKTAHDYARTIPLLSFVGDSFMGFRAFPIDEKGSPIPDMENYRAPEMQLPSGDLFSWHMKAVKNWPPDTGKDTPLAYSFIVNEEGEVTNLRRELGPEIPEIEQDLSRLRIDSPGMLGSTLVRSRCTLEIRVGLTQEEVQDLIRSNAPPVRK